MNYIEIVIAFGLMLAAWVGNEAVHLFKERPAPYFAYVIDAGNDPIISRTGAGYGYARTGFVHRGTFAIRAHSIFDADGNEWAEIKISPFSPHYVWIPVDLTRMTTAFVKRDKLYAIGADILWD